MTDARMLVTINGFQIRPHHHPPTVALSSGNYKLLTWRGNFKQATYQKVPNKPVIGIEVTNHSQTLQTFPEPVNSDLGF